MWYVLELSLCKNFTAQNSGYYAALYPDYLCSEIEDATRFDKPSIDSMLYGELATFDDDLWYRRPVAVKIVDEGHGSRLVKVT